MLAFRQHLIVENPRQIILNDLPLLQSGQSVEVLLLVDDEKTETSTREIPEFRAYAVRKEQEIDELLDRSWGCLGRNKTMDEIDADIAAMRQEWVREWE